MRRDIIVGVVGLLGSLVIWNHTSAQDYGFRLGTRQGEEVSFQSQGVNVLFDALDPQVRKWHLPQELIQEYKHGGWEYTNYAEKFYERYVDIKLEGDNFYDIFGDLITRGWLIYDWSQEQPREFGNRLLQMNRYGYWFRNLMIATDSKGEYHYAMLIGDRIRTVLTPMTFSKPGYNGIEWDFEFEKYTGTFLLSRISAPGRGPNMFEIPDRRTSNTHLFGGRMTRNVGDFITVGATYVNAHQSNTLLGFTKGDPIKGSLTTDQNKEYITFIKIVLSDDSPWDGEAGAAFFSEDIIITDREGNKVRGSEIDFHPQIEGGSQRIGYIAADGNEVITLTYDFESRFYRGPDPSKIHHVSFELVLANDYKVGITSDRQTNRKNKPVFLTVTRARKNVKDKTNPVLIRFDYGLPTANEILGFTVEVLDVHGFHLYGELDFNTRYRQYPNRDLRKHHTSSSKAKAWMINASYRRYPWLLFCEMFDMDYDYTTRSFLAGKQGEIDYEDELRFYEFVDDNDDYNGSSGWGGGLETPGLDENGDFISDFNQNKNPFPDYEEPFLRYSVDRPEYLFGIDLNNNGWIDRFENDEEADYPYKKDHRGYNFYLGAYIVPGARIIVGQGRQLLVSQDRHNLTTYGLFTLDKDYAGLGRLRIFERIKKVRDNIPDDLFQWVQPIGAKPVGREFKDSLSHQNTWVNTSFLGFDWSPSFDFHFINKMKYEILHQRDSDEILEERNANRDSNFFGVINKVDYTHKVGNLLIQPRWKSEYLIENPYLKTDPKRNELRETFSFILKTGFARRHKGRVFKSTYLESGVEATFFNQFSGRAPRGLEEDFFGTVFISQLTNSSAYLGYRIITQVGFRLNRQQFEVKPSRTTGTLFITVFAGIQE